MDQRYALTKFVEKFAVRQLAALCPVKRTGVIITMVAPGLCTTGLGRDARTFTKIMHEALRVMMALTAEEGSRTILHGLVVGEEGHGKPLSGCKIKEFWMPHVAHQRGVPEAAERHLGRARFQAGVRLRLTAQVGLLGHLSRRYHRARYAGI